MVGAIYFPNHQEPRKNLLFNLLAVYIGVTCCYRRAQHRWQNSGHSWCILPVLGISPGWISALATLCIASHGEGTAAGPWSPQQTLGHQTTSPCWYGLRSFFQASSRARSYFHLLMGMERIKILQIKFMGKMGADLWVPSLFTRPGNTVLQFSASLSHVNAYHTYHKGRKTITLK